MTAHKPSIFLISALTLAGLTTVARSEEKSVVIGTDDKTGQEITIKTGKKHPFVAWTQDEVAQIRKDANKGFTDGSWQGAATIEKAKAGDPLSCAKVWAVTGGRAMAGTAKKWLLAQVAASNQDAAWNSVFVYDLIAESGELTPGDQKAVDAYFRKAIETWEKSPFYGVIHNHSTCLVVFTWVTALCLEDVPTLRSAFALYKDMIGKGLFPGGYYYEGTGYIYGFYGCDDVGFRPMIDCARRSGVDLNTLNCRRRSVSDRWPVRPGYVQAAEINTWYEKSRTPTGQSPNIGDDIGPRGGGPLTSSPGDVAFPDTGIFVFRQGTGIQPDDQYVLFLALARWGFHPHCDQGHLDIVRYGRWLTEDFESSNCPRTSGYSPLNFLWSHARWAHNTVVVNGSGDALKIDFPVTHYASAANPAAKVKVADVTMTGFCALPGATQRRRVLVTDDFIVLTDDVVVNKEIDYPNRDPFLSMTDIRDWEGWIGKIVTQAKAAVDSPGKLIWAQLSDRLRGALTEVQAGKKPLDQDTRLALWQELNQRIIDNNDFLHADTAWKDLVKEGHGDRLRMTTLAQKETTQTTREYLENAYPNEIVKNVDHEAPMDWFFHGVKDAKWVLDGKPGKSTAPFLHYVPERADPDHNLVWTEAYETERAWQGRFIVDEKEQIGLKVWQVDVDGKGGKYCAGAFTPPRHACKTGMYDGQRVPLICQRKWGAEARFTVILEPYKGEPKITAVRLVSQDKGQRVIEIELGKNPKQHVMIGEGKYEVSSSQ